MDLDEKVQSLSSWIFERELVIWCIITANVLGTLFGFYFYAPQLIQTDPIFWLFVVDSPLAVLSFATALMMRAFGEKSKLLEAFAFVANVKYGLWTAAVLLFYFDGFTTAMSAPMYGFIFLSHLAMAFQVILIDWNYEIKYLTPLAIWFIVNDFLDYRFGIHSTIYTVNQSLTGAELFAYSLTLLSLLLASRVSMGTPPTNSSSLTSLFTSE